MATTSNSTTGAYDDTPLVTGNGLVGLLGAVLGKETNTTDTGSQTTAGTTATTGTTASTGSQVGSTSNSSRGTTDGTTSQNTTGATTGTTSGNTSSTGTTSSAGGGTSQQSGSSSSNTTGSSNQTGATSQNTTGRTQTSTTGNTSQTGQSSTTGGTNVNTTGNVINNSVTRNDADTAALRQAYATQSHGVTKDMIDAIFQEGARAAPDLIRAHSNAVGTRIDGNTGVATALGDLETKLTRQVADLNRQMLASSADTAGKIASVTGTSTTTGSQQQQSASQQVQDLLTKNSSDTVMKQLADAITNSATTGTSSLSGTNSSSTAGTNSSSGSNTSFNNAVNATTGTNNQTTAGTQTQASTGTNSQTTANSAVGTSNVNTAQTGTTATTGTQNQTVNSTDAKNVTTSINTGAAANLLRGAAAGLGAAALLSLARSAGFTGPGAALSNWFRAQGTSLTPATQTELEAAAAANTDTNPDLNGSVGDVGTVDPGTVVDDLGVNFADGGMPGYAGGGFMNRFGGNRFGQHRLQNGLLPGQMPMNPNPGTPIQTQSLIPNQQQAVTMQAVSPIVGPDPAAMSQIPVQQNIQQQGAYQGNNRFQSGLVSRPDPTQNYGQPISYDTGYADGGGNDFLPIPDLLHKRQLVVGNPDADLNSMLNGMTGSGGGGTTSTGTSTSGGSGSGSNTGGGGPGNSSTGNTTSATGSGHGPVSIGNIVGMIGSLATGNVIGIVTNAIGIANSMSHATTGGSGNASTASSPVGSVTVGALSNPNAAVTDAEADNAAVNNAADQADADTNPDSNGTVGDADATAAAAAATSGDSSSTGDSASSGTSGNGGDGNGDSYANGGSVGPMLSGDAEEANEDPKEEASESASEEASENAAEEGNIPDEAHEALLEAMGISRTGKGGLQFNDHAVRVMHKAITQGAKPTSTTIRGYSNGGRISGPGTGVSDSIPAKGPNGQDIRVSHGEYILPADTVAHVGAHNLDALVQQTHIPAELQRAMFGD